MSARLVTLIGGGGFLGRYVTQELLKREVRVRIVQRDPRAASFLKPLGTLGQLQFVAADVRQAASLRRATEGSDAVVNLVGILKGDFRAFHVRGARNAAEAASATGARAFVQVSAIGADKRSPSAYGRSKAEGEAAVAAAFAGATIMRPSIVFGREDQFINRFAGMIASAPAVPVVRAAARFQPVYVADVAEAVARAALDPAAHGGTTYELGGPDVISMGALIRWIAREIARMPAIVELPDAVSAAIASMGFLPGAPITWDQWRMLGRDNVVADDAKGLAALGIAPTPMATVAPGWLVRFRRHGRFTASHA